MSTTIYLTRHGQTEWNLERRLQGRGNSPLTDEGIQKAKELQSRINDIKIDVIYTSPIERAYETAKILRGSNSINIILEDGLMEMSFGDYEGEKVDEIKKKDQQWDINLIMKGNIELMAPNGETLSAVRSRVKCSLDRIIEENKNKTILIVTHGIALKAVMYYFNDEEVNSEVMGQATLTKIVVNDNKDSIIEFKNDDSHFAYKEKKLGW